MSESKTYVFGQDGNSNVLNTLVPLLSQRGIDPSVLVALQNNGGFGNNGAWFIWILFLLVFGWGGNGFGFGGNRGAGLAGDAYLGNLITNENGRDMLQQLINGNTSRISELASMLNTSTQSIQNSLCQLQTAISGVGNQVGMSGMQTINAIQSGNAAIASQIAKCCCDSQLAICQQTNTIQQAINSVNVGQERGFAQIGYNTAQQTCEIRDAIRENTAQVLAGQRSAEMREMQRELAERDRKIAEQASEISLSKQTGLFSQMITQATTPIMNMVAGVQKDIDNVKCKLPETTTVPYSPVVGVPTCVAAQYGLGFGLTPFGAWG